MRTLKYKQGEEIKKARCAEEEAKEVRNNLVLT